MTATLEHQSRHADGAAYLAQGIQQVRALRVQADVIDADRERRCARISDTYSRVVRRILRSDLSHEQAKALQNAAWRRALERLNAVSESGKAAAAAYREAADLKERALPLPATVEEAVTGELELPFNVIDRTAVTVVRVVPSRGYSPVDVAVAL